MQQVQQTSSVERAVMLSLHDTLNRNRVLGSDYDYIMSDLEPGNYSSAEASRETMRFGPFYASGRVSKLQRSIKRKPH